MFILVSYKLQTENLQGNGLYGPAMIPGPQMIPDCKWSPNRAEMIPIKNMEWHGYWNGVDLRMTIDVQLWSKRLGTLKEMRRENTPCLLKSYFTCYNAWSCCWRSPFLLSPLPSAGGGGVRGWGRENESISPAVALLSQYSNIGFYECMTCIRTTTYIIT